MLVKIAACLNTNKDMLMAAIFRQQGNPYSENDIADACRYLHDKGLVDFRNVKSEALHTERDIAYITSGGVDVLEGATPIDGVYLG